MTENEKLRALLAEARHGLQDHDDTLHDVARCECWCCGLCRRIDAALAEPVEEESQYGIREDRDSLRVEIKRLERERDEARADLKLWEETAQKVTDLFDPLKPKVCPATLRLTAEAVKAANKTLRERLTEARAEVERLQAEVRRVWREYLEATARITRMRYAYQRGAEAMREAAIRACEEPQMGTEADAIRALPVPEDKP